MGGKSENRSESWLSMQQSAIASVMLPDEGPRDSVAETSHLVSVGAGLTGVYPLP